MCYRVAVLVQAKAVEVIRVDGEDPAVHQLGSARRIDEEDAARISLWSPPAITLSQWVLFQIIEIGRIRHVADLLERKVDWSLRDPRLYSKKHRVART